MPEGYTEAPDSCRQQQPQPKNQIYLMKERIKKNISPFTGQADLLNVQNFTQP